MPPSPKRILIDVGHPVDLHLFRNFAQELEHRGWNCLFVAKDKDVLVSLIKAYNLTFLLIGRNIHGIFHKILSLPRSFQRFYTVVKSFNPRLAAGVASLHCSWICAATRIPQIAFIDTESRGLIDKVTLPFIKSKITATSYYRDLGRHHFRYPGNHELAYLHPNRFTPDRFVKTALGLTQDEPYCIVRFVAWKALHDLGRQHMNEEQRIELVRMISRYKRVFISSETVLPAALKSYQFPLPPHKLHHALAFADLYIGEGITMASEAATMGIPAVLLNPLRMGYCIEAEKKGMLFQFPKLTPEARIKIQELLAVPQIRKLFKSKHHSLLAGKIDVTAFMVWFVENYPDSEKALEKDPDLVLNFK